MEFYNRLIHGLWLAGLTLYVSWAGGNLFTFYLASICTLGYSEWIVMSSKNELKPYRFIGLSIIAVFQQSIYWLRQNDPQALVRLLLSVWSTDTGSYFFGKYLGGPKFCVALSPNKTISGLLGGVLCGMIGGKICGGNYLESMVISFASQMGDLSESLSKRMARIKDSNLEGLAIPGHGGILDRIDALLMAAPFSFVFSYLKS